MFIIMEILIASIHTGLNSATRKAFLLQNTIFHLKRGHFINFNQKMLLWKIISEQLIMINRRRRQFGNGVGPKTKRISAIKAI